MQETQHTQQTAFQDIETWI